MFDPYKKSIDEKGSALLISVVGGRLSEGINFKDDLGNLFIYKILKLQKEDVLE